jgi:hypothetical protein
MALPSYYKLVIANGTGVNLDLDGSDTLVISGLPWNRNSSGALVYGSEFSFGTFTTDIGIAGVFAGSAINNTSTLYEGVFCIVELGAESTNPDGPLMFYLDWSTDGGTTYASSGADFDYARCAKDLMLVGVMNPEGDGDDVINYIFEI